MPHPHEQKLHEVVNSLTSESFKSFVAARTAETSRSPRARGRSPGDGELQEFPAGHPGRIVAPMGAHRCLLFAVLPPNRTACQGISGGLRFPAAPNPSYPIGVRHRGTRAALDQAR